jgi:hypothetical protein
MKEIGEIETRVYIVIDLRRVLGNSRLENAEDYKNRWMVMVQVFTQC